MYIAICRAVTNGLLLLPPINSSIENPYISAVLDKITSGVTGNGWFELIKS